MLVMMVILVLMDMMMMILVILDMRMMMLNLPPAALKPFASSSVDP